MLHIRNLSWLMLGLGVVMAIAGEALDLGAVVTLIGLMLIVAGVVKVITVRIWHGFFDGEAVAGKRGESVR
jgi:hypothetical protein